jgi:hypothetical protein
MAQDEVRPVWRFIIVGYQPDDHGRVANLKVAMEGADGSLRYAGAVGTGLTESSALMLKRSRRAFGPKRDSRRR